jgi:hypothetical protein
MSSKLAGTVGDLAEIPGFGRHYDDMQKAAITKALVI